MMPPLFSFTRIQGSRPSADRARRFGRRDKAMWAELEGLLDSGVPDTLVRDVGLDLLDPEEER